LEEINLTINGKAINCPPGTSILDAATENNIKIPTLCNHTHLKPAGACRLCIVKEEKSGRIFASCVTPVSPDMAIRTETPDIKRYRTDIIRLMVANHPESCILCNQGNRCELRQVAADLGVGATGLYPMPHYTGLEEANPFIIRDLSKCILCGRCIRADHELVVVGAIDFNLRGFRSRPATVHQLPLEKSECTFCGTCVSLCPTGALMTKNKNHTGSPHMELSSICGFCGAGCTLKMGSVNGQVVEVNPSHEEGTVNMSTLCVRGHFAHDFLNSPERLAGPLIRKDNELSPASWDEALELVSERFLSIKKENGPQSLGCLGSSKCSTEENYLFQKMARVFLGTNNIDNDGYLYGRHVISALDERLFGGERIRPLKGLEKAELIFVLGADPTRSIPVAGYYIKRAARNNKVPMIVADPRKTGLLPFASIWLQIAPQSDLGLINGLAAMLLKQDAHDKDFIKQSTTGFEQYRDSLVDLDLERVFRITGIERELLEKASALMKGKRVAFVVGHGILQQKNGRVSMDALVNLAMMTGSLGGEGKGIYLMSGASNRTGSLDMGTTPDYLPGRQPLKDASIRKYWEKSWKTMLSPDPGLDMFRMIEEAEKGNLKALYIMGENILRSLPSTERVRKALKRVEFLVVQDILTTECTDMADVVLPGAAFCEKMGSFTNIEGRIQFFDPVVEPPGESRPDWMILDLLLEKMGNDRRYESIKNIRKEMSGLIPMYGGLRSHGKESWVRETSRMKLFNEGGDGELIPFSRATGIEEGLHDDAYPFKAILCPPRYHLGSGTRTSLSVRVKDFALGGELELSPVDTERLNLKDGDQVRISSLHGNLLRDVKINRGVKTGTIFVPTAINRNEAKELLGLAQTDGVDSPGWISCDVKVERAE